MEKQVETISITEAKTFPDPIDTAWKEEVAEKTPSVLEKSSPNNDKLLFVLTNGHFVAVAVTGEGTLDDPTLDEVVRLKRCRSRYAHTCRSMKRANRKCKILPVSSKDLKNTSLEQRDLNFKAFARLVLGSVLDISPQHHGFLLILCCGFISYQAESLTTPFHEFSFGKTPQSLLSLSLEEAVFAFFPEITHITKFMLCYILTWVLVSPLPPRVQIFFVLLLISAPLFYFPELVRKASGVDVVFGGSFKLPLIWFATLGAFGLSLMCGLVALLAVYVIWRFVYEGTTTRAKDIEVSLDGLSSVILGG